MKVTVIGSGYVGLVTGACLAEVGNHVVCLDVDVAKIALLQDGGSPIYEPGLIDMIRRNAAEGRLRFTTDIEIATAHGEVQFIAVGTPPGEDGSADLSHVIKAAEQIARHMTDFKVVVNKSTVPVGTADKVREVIATALRERGQPASFTVISNPEFLKEGAAIEDFMRPDRVIVGVDDTEAGKRGKRLMRALYAPFQRNHDRMQFMDIRSAELTKYAANAMLATRISFMNELANLAESLGADIEAVRQGIGSDPRIGYSFLYPGCGYGGSCFPKDVKALIRTAHGVDKPLHVLAAVERANEHQKQVLVDKVVARFGERLHGHRFAIWGLSFKPGTDDMREASSRVIIRGLLQRGAEVVAFDPVAQPEAERVLEDDLCGVPGAWQRLHWAADGMAAVTDADALLIITEWKTFRSPDFQGLRATMRQPVIIDGRNLYDPALMADYGLVYDAIGRQPTALD